MPAVAGMFYPDDPGELHEMVSGFLAQAAEGPAPKAFIAPHAGYIYSGLVAASAYRRLAAVRQQIRRVVLLGPSHRMPFSGLAVSTADTFRTPLGDIPLDAEAVMNLLELPQVVTLDRAHSMEHSLEVHLPFLQETLGEFTLVPLVVGDATADQVAEVLELLWGGPETLIVVSSDLSHYHPYEEAKRLDSATSSAIEALNPEKIGFDDACGRIPVIGLLRAAQRHGLYAKTIDLRNSGDTAGPRDQVVGYGAYVFN
jgi:AmmeMemoRadiSam system protein B